MIAYILAAVARGGPLETGGPRARGGSFAQGYKDLTGSGLSGSIKDYSAIYSDLGSC